MRVNKHRREKLRLPSIERMDRSQQPKYSMLGFPIMEVETLVAPSAGGAVFEINGSLHRIVVLRAAELALKCACEVMLSRGRR